MLRNIRQYARAVSSLLYPSAAAYVHRHAQYRASAIQGARAAFAVRTRRRSTENERRGRFAVRMSHRIGPPHPHTTSPHPPTPPP